MLTVTLTTQGYKLSVDYNGHTLHFKEWDATDARIYYMPLATLVDNGHASYDKEGCYVPFESMEYLDEEDRSLG